MRRCGCGPSALAWQDYCTGQGGSTWLVTATYTTEVAWKGEHWGHLVMGNGPEMDFSAPPDAHGHAGVLTPEDAFVAAANTCVMMMFLWACERFKLDLVSYRCRTEGTKRIELDRTEIFTELRFWPEIVVRAGAGDDAAATESACAGRWPRRRSTAWWPIPSRARSLSNPDHDLGTRRHGDRVSGSMGVWMYRCALEHQVSADERNTHLALAKTFDMTQSYKGLYDLTSKSWVADARTATTWRRTRWRRPPVWASKRRSRRRGIVPRYARYGLLVHARPGDQREAGQRAAACPRWPRSPPC